MQILLVNPPIYDFACFDYWLKPLGLLYIADFLRKNNIDIELFDFMDRHSEYLEKYIPDKEFATGNFHKTKIEKPSVLEDFPRQYYRYGVDNNKFIKYIEHNKFEYIFITSMMTYWYPGIEEIINSIRENSDAVIILGGVYARLMPEHAKSLKPDFVFSSDISSLPEFLSKYTSLKGLNSYDYEDLLPAYDLYTKNSSAAIFTQLGCPFRCTYCAIGNLNPVFKTLDHNYIIKMLDYLEHIGITDIAFYDDALLYKRKEHFLPLFKKIQEKKYNLRFHFSNGLHISYIDEQVIETILSLNTGRIALSIESLSDSFHKSIDNKTDYNHILNGMNLIIKSDLLSKDIYVYIMGGIPGQTIDEIEETAEFVHSKGFRILMNEFSPVPTTPIYASYKDKLADPVLTGKSVFGPMFVNNVEKYQMIKNKIKKYNMEL